jgi:Protein of unknown function (DUF3365)
MSQSIRPAPRGSSRPPARRSVHLLLPLAILIVAAGSAMWTIGQSLMMRQTLNESRTVADMVENIGRWASQYGGMHAKTVGTDAKIPGNFLTRSVYTVNSNDAGLLQGAQVSQYDAEQAAMSRVEAYHWKNPAMIQREVADVVAASGSKAVYRLTARTVLNANNAPDAFEREALDVVAAAAERGEKTPEHWKVQGSTLLYARSVSAQSSCLRCHETPEKAPAFLRTNAQFNGGGGYGYVSGKPAGLISVKVPLTDPWSALVTGAPKEGLAALGIAIAAAVWLAVAALRRRR